jgi:hypothetical protein
MMVAVQHLVTYVRGLLGESDSFALFFLGTIAALTQCET